jgi:uncharacterized protein YcfL
MNPHYLTRQIAKLGSKFLIMGMVVLLCSCSSYIDKRSIKMGKTGDIKIQDMKSFDRNGLLVAQAIIKNNGNSKPVQYRFQWFGDKGQRVWGDEAWKPLVIPEGRTAMIEGVAPNMEASEYKIELDSY